MVARFFLLAMFVAMAAWQAGFQCVSAAAIIDTFDNGRLDSHWDSANFPQNGSGKLDHITCGEPPAAGKLVVEVKDILDSGDQITFIQRDDARLQSAGDYVQVDVQFLGGAPDVNAQAGLALATTPHGLLRDRSSTVMCAFRRDGNVRLNAYGSSGRELPGLSLDSGAYPPGSVVTLRLVRSSPLHFQLWHGLAGQSLKYLGTIEMDSGQGFPAVPGLLLGNGLSDFKVQFDNFLVGHTTVEPKSPPPPLATPIPASEQVTLTLPKPITNLPKAPSTRYMVHQPTSAQEYTYHHSPMAAVWKGRLFIAWHAMQQGEDTPPYKGMVASAPLTNLNRWTDAVAVTHLDTAEYERYIREHYNIPAEKQLIVSSPPRTLLATPDKLYLFCLGWATTERKHFNTEKYAGGRIFWTSDGVKWNEIPQAELDRMEKTQGLSAMRSSSSNHSFAHLRDGRLMAYCLGNGGLWCPTTTDPTGLTGWQGPAINCKDADDVGEPGGWEGPDGVLHGTSRWNERIWHAFSRDGGKSWSKLAEQPFFSDCPGNKDFGTMPDGSVWYIGNPVPGSRDTLVLGLSQDGWHFNSTYAVRWESVPQRFPAAYKSIGGYQYPDATYYNGMLYTVYSVQREAIEVSAIKVADLPGWKGRQP